MSELDIRCQRCGRVEELTPHWEAAGEEDAQGIMLGVCPGCQTHEEQADAGMPDPLALVLMAREDLQRAQETIRLERAIEESEVLLSLAALLQSVEAHIDALGAQLTEPDE